MIDCPNAATAYQSDTCLNESCCDVQGNQYTSVFGIRGQDIRSRGAGAGSRGAIDDCCEQGLGRSSLDVPAVNTRYPNRHANQKESYAVTADFQKGGT